MNDVKKKNSVQDQAIHEYLESLLLEVPDDDETAGESTVADIELAPVTETPVVEAQVVKVQSQVPLTHAEPEPAVVGIDQLVAEIPEVITETEVVTEVITEVVVEVETITEVQSEIETPVVSESGVPIWAETRFQCLLFNVSGLNLAVPLVKLNNVIPWDENITETPNQTEWYLGLVQHLQNQVKVIDTALLVMPENRRDNLKNDTDGRLSHILLVDDYQWGLACSSIGDVIWMNQDEVKWRKNKSSREWLSGTSLEHLCAIMDTEVFAQMLTKSA